MILDRLTDYYGDAGDDEKEFLEQKTVGFTSDGQDKLYNYIIENRPKKNGFPDIAFLSKAIRLVKENVTDTRYFWCICNKCHGGYAYDLMQCPHCYKKGITSRSYTVKVSDTKPPINVIRYNKPSVSRYGDTLSCFECPNATFSYCPNFGKPDYYCKDFTECKCNRCCTIVKKVNREQFSAKEEKQE